LAVHIERDERLAAHWEDRLLHESLADLRAFFPEGAAVEAVLQELAQSH
jgi:hypothetical protein